MNRRSFAKWIGGSLVGVVGGGAAYSAYRPGNSYYSGPRTDHFNGDHFLNPGGEPPRKFFQLLKWQLEGGRAKWPRNYPSPFDGAKPTVKVDGDDIQVTMLGHATLLLQVGGRNFLTDPVFVERASPVQFVGPKRVNPPGVRFEDLPPIDYVLLSHNHYDHMDLASLARLVSEHSCKIICPLGNDVIIRDRAPDAECIVGDWGDMFELDGEMKVHFEPCHHWSARGTKDRRWALWAAFVLETPAGKIYHIGDTGFNNGKHYQALFEKHGVMRLAILPIGAYEPRWFMKAQHQNPEEAVRGHLLCKAEVSIAHHWGTFQLTNEAIEAPVEALAVAREQFGLGEEAFVTLKPGETWHHKQT